ncbi:hypothetical protein Poli38472_010231 [Pythium oligandrum]|uniref:Protein kinase domain-containing protein n=1 Tax=Pythium oligandrum TaxID=41045 RepID=A0A8K1C8T6_PYTOL|nr:hypothetical protein Poli38472_010231 [Pythium oligandrum]|eukprot:TMW58672.1 hypothetical protein Poli38472_010231 [Pythium oligandrum]
MMTPSAFHDDHSESTQSYTSMTRRPRDSGSLQVTSLCSFVTLAPLQAIQRLVSCFGYTHTVHMQSGRTVVVGTEIAQGGFSFVYNARDAATGEAFALKKILCQTEEQIAMAKQEIEMHRSFMHPNIMPISDYAVVSLDTHVHEYYLLFPFIENGTLREMIDISLQQRTPIPERVIFDIFLKICRAVGELHARSPPLAHRDLKPENVLLTRDNDPILTDFGSVAIGDVTISKRSDALLLQEHAAQFSSMAYRAPELYDAGDNTHITSRTDVWSLGCLLYAMAFGYSPFECSFLDNGDVKIVECSYLAVIGTIKFPKKHSRSNSLLELISGASACQMGLFRNLIGGAHLTNMSPTTDPQLVHAHSGEGSTRCDCCKSCGAILELEGCGHRFHPRCVYTYPMTQCEICSTPVTTVKIFRVFQNLPNSMVRKGKWSSDEHKYANMMMKQFQMGAVPLVDGLHLRGFIANLLQCDPLRVTKKYSGHAIGKQNFFYQRQKSYCYNLHTKLQKRISSLRNHFYWHIQYRCKFGYSMNIQELKSAEADYWIREFLKFADKIGQPVEMATVSSSSVAPMSPMPSPTKERVLQQSPPLLAMAAPVLHASVPQHILKEATVNRNVVVKEDTSEQQQQQQLDVEPSFKLESITTTQGAVSPLSFDEWNENPTNAAYTEMLDTTVLDDFAQLSQTQFSAVLSDIISSATSGNPSVNPSNASPSTQSTSTRCSLGDWLVAEESRWNDSKTATSWSFSLTLSDCL